MIRKGSDSSMAKRSAHNTVELIKLRLMLLRIWFMKNLMTFVKVLIAVVFVLMLFGQINEDTPVLGILIYPLLKPLIDSINEIIATRDASGFMGFASSALSILITVSIFTIKLKSISQNDIKNKDLKIAMVKAGLYFNENGKLVKKVEKATGADINGDGVIDENDIVKSEGFFKGITRAISEFVTVITTDISEGETADEKIDEVAKSIDATETKEALDEIDHIVITSTLDRAAEIVNRTFDRAVENVEKTEAEKPESEEKEKQVKYKTGFLNKIRSGFLCMIHGVKNIFVRSKENANEEDGDTSMEEKNNIVTSTEEAVVKVEKKKETTVIETVEAKEEKASEPEVKTEVKKQDVDINAMIRRSYM